MNHVHKDGRALLRLSRKTYPAQEEKSSKVKPAADKAGKPDSAPKPGIQRQDTDYDVKPSIPKPKPDGPQPPSRPRHAR